MVCCGVLWCALMYCDMLCVILKKLENKLLFSSPMKIWHKDLYTVYGIEALWLLYIPKIGIDNTNLKNCVSLLKAFNMEVLQSIFITDLGDPYLKVIADSFNR